MKGKKVWEILPKLAKLVKSAHRQTGVLDKGHGFDHDLCVATYAHIVAPDPETALLAGAAGFCHSADHVITNAGAASLAWATIVPKQLVMDWLEMGTDFSAHQKERVILAVVNHRTPNREGDDIVKTALQDGDKLANLMATLFARSASYQSHLPVLDPVYFEKNPTATYANPGSVLFDVNYCANQWVQEQGPYRLVLPKAREIGLPMAAHLRLVIDTIRFQREQIGLVPYPSI